VGVGGGGCVGVGWGGEVVHPVAPNTSSMTTAVNRIKNRVFIGILLFFEREELTRSGVETLHLHSQSITRPLAKRGENVRKSQGLKNAAQRSIMS
jgi:hypothetical protein